MYLSHQEYKDMGGTLEPAAFSRWEYAARALIDQYTFKRVSKMATVPESVKQLMFELVDMEHKANLETPAITSFSTDGYSESYAKAPTPTEAAAAMSEAVVRFLSGETDDSGTPLLYRGVG